MKKLISLILALALGLAMFPAFAEETETETVNPDVLEWGTVAAQLVEAGIQGGYYTLNGNVIFWVPEYLAPADIDTNYEETDALAAFSTKGREKGFIIYLYEMQAESLDQFAVMAEVYGGREGRRLLINGLEAYSYMDGSFRCVAFLAGGGRILSFDFFPGTDESFAQDIMAIAASIRPYDPQQEE